MSDAGAEMPLLDEAKRLIDAAAERDLVLRLLGGLAIQYLTPDLPPRTRTGQDLDLGSLSSQRRPLTAFLEESGYVQDKMFNALNGDKQLYFTHGETGLAIDVLLDKLHMSHTLEFRDRLTRLPYTLDPIDLLLSKLQIFELNEKDADDCLRLLVSFPFDDASDPSVLDLRVFRELVAEDWGWWRTVTLNLERIRRLASGSEGRGVAGGRFDPLEQLTVLEETAEQVPKSRRWKLRSKVGERKRWYELPDETQHE